MAKSIHNKPTDMNSDISGFIRLCLFSYSPCFNNQHDAVTDRVKPSVYKKSITNNLSKERDVMQDNRSSNVVKNLREKQYE